MITLLISDPSDACHMYKTREFISDFEVLRQVFRTRAVK